MRTERVFQFIKERRVRAEFVAQRLHGAAHGGKGGNQLGRRIRKEKVERPTKGDDLSAQFLQGMDQDMARVRADKLCLRRV